MVCPAVQAAETLLCAGASLILEPFGCSLLMLAVNEGNADMVMLLLRKGLCHVEGWWTPLVYAVMEVRPSLHVHMRTYTACLKASFRPSVVS